VELAPASGERAEQLAMEVGEVFCDPAPEVALAGRATLLEALQAGIAAKMAVLDDPDMTGTGQSSAEVLGVPGGVLAETLPAHLVQKIMVGGSRVDRRAGCRMASRPENGPRDARSVRTLRRYACATACARPRGNSEPGTSARVTA
jgi:hypothetical protein